MKRNLKTLFSFMLVAALLVAAFVCGAVNVAAEGEPFSVDGVACADWSAAWSAALNSTDKIIKLETDFYEWTEKPVSLSGNVSLDLNGHILAVGKFITVSGSNLMDSSNGGGKVICTDDALELHPDNSYLPVWVGDGYVLVQPNLSATYQKFVAQDDGSYYFAFRPGFGKINGTTSVANTYLKNNADHGLQMEFTLITGDSYAGEKTEKQYFYGADAFAQVYGENKMFFARFRGAENVEHLAVKTVIYSAKTGVEYTSEAVTGKATMLDFGRVTEGDTKLDTLGSKINIEGGYLFEDNTLKLSDTAFSATTSYAEVLAPGTFYLELKLSNYGSSGTFYIRTSKSATSTANAERYILVEAANATSGGVVTQYGRVRAAGQVIGNAVGENVVDLRMQITNTDTTNAETGEVERTTVINVINVNTGNQKTVTLTTTAIRNSYFNIYADAMQLNVADMKMYVDVNATFGDALQDQKVEKTVTWTWDDSNNADKLRPSMVKVAAYNGETKVNEAEVNAAAGTYTFGNLPKYDANGNEIVYTFDATVEHYVVVKNGDALTFKHTPFTITYYYNNEFENTNLTASGASTNILDANDKAFTDQAGAFLTHTEDGNTFVEMRYTGSGTPRAHVLSVNSTFVIKFRVRLLNADSSVASYLRLRTNGSEAYLLTFSGKTLTMYKTYDGTNKHSVTLSHTEWTDVYICLENGVATYQVGGLSGSFAHTDVGRFQFVSEAKSGVINYEGLCIDDLQLYTPYESTSISGSVVWNDGDDQDGLRKDVTVNLYNGSILVDSKLVSGGEFTFADLPKTNATNGQDYVYTVDVVAPDGYTKTRDGNNFTFTHVPTTEDVSVSWTWDDSNDNDDIRPANITIGLYVDGAMKYEKSVPANAGQYTFENIDIADYELRVSAIDGYEINVNGYVATLSHAKTITWFYKNDFRTPADGEAASIVDSIGNSMAVTAKYHEVTEDGYLVIRGDASNAAQFRIMVSGTANPVVDIRFKVRLENADTMVPYNKSYFTVLRASTSNNRFAYFYDQKLVVGSHNCDLTATDWVDVYIQVDVKAEKLYYQLTDAAKGVQSGESAFTGNFDRVQLYSLTNGVFGLCFDDLKISKGVAKTSVTGSVAFDDSDNNDGIRPNSVTVNLLQNGVKIDSAVVNAESNWAYSFADLLKYDETNAAYTYTVEAAPVDGYTASYADGIITLTYVPTEKDVEVTWTWDDGNNNDKIRPNKIIIELSADGEVKYSQEVAADALTYTFNKVAFTDYEVRVNVNGYNTVVNGYNATLIHTPTINWLYDNDFSTEDSTPNDSKLYDGKVYDQKIYGDKYKDHNISATAGQYTVNNGYLEYNGIKGSNTMLFRYVTSSDGAMISYKVRLPEGKSISGGSSTYSVVLRSLNSGSYTKFAKMYGNTVYIGSDSASLSETEWLQIQIQVDVSGGLYYYHMSNESGTVNIYGSEALVGTFARFEMFDEAKTDFSILFDDLQISTRPVEVFKTTSVDWADAGDDDGIRPDSVTVELLKNGVFVDSVVLSDANKWTAAFAELAKYDENSAAYTYTTQLTAVPDGYTVVEKNGAFTLSHTPAVEYTYNNDFAVENDGSSDILQDYAGRELDNMTSGSYVVEDGCLKVSGIGTDNFTTLFRQMIDESAYPMQDISFKVRLDNADTMLPLSDKSECIVLRINNDSDHEKVVKFYNQMVTVGGVYYTLSADSWVGIHLVVDYANDIAYFELTDGNGTVLTDEEGKALSGTFECVGAGERWELFDEIGGDYTLHIDDLQISRATGETFF